MANDVQITERGYRDSCLGRVLQLKIFTADYRTLSWREVCDAFNVAYPGRWAVQVFPPADRIVDGKSVYHVFVVPEGEKLDGLDLR